MRYVSCDARAARLVVNPTFFGTWGFVFLPRALLARAQLSSVFGLRRFAPSRSIAESAIQSQHTNAHGRDMKRRIAVVGDTLTNGGHILDYEQAHGFTFHGHKAALIGNDAYCDACKSTGRIAMAGGPYRRSFDTARKVALDGDLVLCKCPKLPRIAASLAGPSWCDDRNEGHARAVADSTSVNRTDDIAPQWISFALMDRGNVGGLRCVAHFDDGSQEFGAFGSDNTARFERFDNDSVCTGIELLMDDVEVSESVTESLLSIIVG